MNAPKPITLATLSSSTEQEVFDWVVHNLRKQGTKSLREKGGTACMYRSPEGLKCAAGWLIADDEYDKSWDHPVSNDWSGLAHELDLHVHDELISSLQDIHDTCAVEKWEDAWQRLANRRELSYSPPQ